MKLATLASFVYIYNCWHTWQYMEEIPPIPMLIDELGADKLELLRGRIETDTVHNKT